MIGEFIFPGPGELQTLRIVGLIGPNQRLANTVGDYFELGADPALSLVCLVLGNKLQQFATARVKNIKAVKGFILPFEHPDGAIGLAHGGGEVIKDAVRRDNHEYLRKGN